MRAQNPLEVGLQEAPASSSPLLSAEGLCLAFGGVTAANNVSVSVNKGERLAIIGTNGAGKTTFINMVTGYIKPRAGRIIFSGMDITRLTPKEVVRIGVRRSFQIPQLFSSMTVLENMLVALVLTRRRGRFDRFYADQRKEEARELLDGFGLQSHAGALVTELSHGTRKLVDIAMAAIGRPRIVFLDEPTSGLSAQEREYHVSKMLSALEQAGVTPVLVEHDMNVVRAHATRVAAFHQGAIIADGPTEDVLTEPRVCELIVGRR